MTSVERFLLTAIAGCSVALGVFVFIAYAEGVLVLAVPAFVVAVLVIAGLSAWGWRREYGRATTSTARTPAQLVLGGLLQAALVIVTIAFALTTKDGLALVTGLFAVSVAALLARSQLRRSRPH
jgi:hypothetical protein